MIKQIKDYDFLKNYLWNDEELYNRISDDYTRIDKWNPLLSEWFGFFENDECLGILSVDIVSSIVLSVHIHIPKKHRNIRSFEIGNSLLKHVEQVADKRFVKINAWIPTIYPDVARFAEKNGFSIEGLDKKSYIKNGKYYDRFVYGKVIR